MTPDDLNHAWTHRQILELNFNNRLNFFLLFQSILLAGTVNSIGRGHTQMILVAYCAFGGVISILWYLIQMKEYNMLVTVKDFLRKHDAVYSERRKMYDGYLPWFSVSKLMSRVIPLALTLIWVALLIYILNVY